jgi:hypothetical protein
VSAEKEEKSGVRLPNGGEVGWLIFTLLTADAEEAKRVGEVEEERFEPIE